MQEPQWEYTTQHLSAATLKKRDETLDNAELAKRLSEAIIEAVSTHKTSGWEPLGMEFHNGEVTLNFRRLQTTAIKP
jgi:hypothetical protein